MATELLPISASATNSADFTVDDPVTLHLKVSSGVTVGYTANVSIQIKSSSGQYTTVGALSDVKPAVVVAGAGTYRVSRHATGLAVGVERS